MGGRSSDYCSEDSVQSLAGLVIWALILYIIGCSFAVKVFAMRRNSSLFFKKIYWTRCTS
jgi:hypothetical protein